MMLVFVWPSFGYCLVIVVVETRHALSLRYNNNNGYNNNNNRNNNRHKHLMHFNNSQIHKPSILHTPFLKGELFFKTTEILFFYKGNVIPCAV